MKLWALRCGDLYTDVGGLVAGDPKGVMADVPVMCFAVDTDDGVLVFDTGMHEACCGPDPVAHFGAMWNVFEIRCPRHALVDERLRQAGYTVDQVRWVVNSHLHFDHAGRNAAFPAATQYVRTRELDWAWEQSKKTRGVLAGDLAELTADLWDYDDTFDLAPGLRLVSTPGHTPGHQALLVTFTDGRSYVCAGDAAYTLQAIVEHNPTGRGADLEQSVASLHTLTSLGAEILTAHDVDQWRDVQDASLIHSG
ncbi:MAG: N-acyl homoserine lactonase family protein [Ilumatobacteraceae bacterium]|nr:N-acyl homoserine lactonase family protein [Ilumatobacteraceae bacterium]